MEIQKARIIQKNVRVLLCPCGREHILGLEDTVSPANQPEQVAPRMGVSPAKRQPRANRKHARWTPAEDAQLLALWQKGVPYRAMTRELGRSMKSIECHLRKTTRQVSIRAPSPTPAAAPGRLVTITPPTHTPIPAAEATQGKRRKDGIHINRFREEIGRLDDIGTAISIDSLAKRIGCDRYHASYILHYEWKNPDSRLHKNFVRERYKVHRGWAYRYIPTHVYYNDKAPRR